MKASLFAYLPLVIYILCLLGGKFWYLDHSEETSDIKDPFKINFQSHFGEWRFVEEELSESIMERLGHGDIQNGFYTNQKSSERYSFFLGEWDPNNARQMSVVSHTPDVCWVGAGWKTVELGQPDKTFFTLNLSKKSKSPELGENKQQYFLETRVFEHALTQQQELAMWITIIDGRIVNEPGLLGLATSEGDSLLDGKKLASLRNSQNSVHRFLTAIRERKTWSGNKLFYRVSTPVDDENWELAHSNIKSWIRLWFYKNTESKLSVSWH